MTALSTAEAALRRAPDDPAVPVTVSGAEAAALVAELDRLRERGDELLAAAEDVGDGVTHATGKPTTAQMIDRLCRLDQARREWKEARDA